MTNRTGPACGAPKTKPNKLRNGGAQRNPTTHPSTNQPHTDRINEIGSDRLIQAALDGVLAGLTRREEADAPELFARVLDELDLAPNLPVDPTAARWELVRWLCEQIVDRRLPANVGGRLIWWEGWNELGYPSALQPIVGWVSEWEDWTPSWNVPHDTYIDRIIDAASRLLARPWPPTTQ